MSALVGYGSSDDDEDSKNEKTYGLSKPAAANEDANATDVASEPHRVSQAQKAQPMDPSGSSAPTGPVAGPAMAAPEDSQNSRSPSPYTSDRALIMNLTLPPVPNFDIPDSPPGSPDPAVAAKLAQFGHLKKQGVHFNERLANSTSIKNPNLFTKLLGSFGISDADQYATTLPESVWNPSSLPSWAYKEELAKAQVEAQKRRDSEKSQSLRENFVPASDPAERGRRE